MPANIIDGRNYLLHHRRNRFEICSLGSDDGQTDEYLEIVLSQISNRQWTIRNMIEWLKFTNGVN